MCELWDCVLVKCILLDFYFLILRVFSSEVVCCDIAEGSCKSVNNLPRGKIRKRQNLHVNTQCHVVFKIM
jgi:hypothetical protein